MIRLALYSALSDRAAEGKVAVVDEWSFAAPKTKDAVAALAALGLERSRPRRPRSRRRHRRPLLRQPADVQTFQAPSSTPTTCCAATGSCSPTPPCRGDRAAGRGEAGRAGRRRARRPSRTTAATASASDAERPIPPTSPTTGDRRRRRTAPDEGSDAVKDAEPGPAPTRRLGEVLRPHGGRHLHLRGGPRRHQDRGAPCRRARLRRPGEEREHAEPQGQAPPQPQVEHHRDPGLDTSGPSSPSWAATTSTCSRRAERTRHGPAQAQAHQCRPPVPVRLGLRRDHPVQARALPRGPQARHRRPQQLRAQDGPAPRWRPQAAVPHHRLQAGQGRRPRQGRRHRVRPQPQRPHRAAALLRRREALHPRPRPGQGGRRAGQRPGLGDPPRATPSRCATSRWARRCTTSNCAPARAASSPGARA